jgi:hypothetical protein
MMLAAPTRATMRMETELLLELRRKGIIVGQGFTTWQHRAEHASREIRDAKLTDAMTGIRTRGNSERLTFAQAYERAYGQTLTGERT